MTSRRRPLRLTACIGLTLSGCDAAGTARAPGVDAAAHDLEGSVASLTADAIMFPPEEPPVIGRAAIREYMRRSFATPHFSIAWTTDTVVVATSGDMAYSFARSRYTLPGRSGAAGAVDTAYGKGVSVWRREADGTWRAAADIWNGAPTSRARRRLASGMLADADRLPTLTAGRLQLRWLTPDDAPALLAVFGDPAVCRYWSRPPLPDLAAAAALQREIEQLFAERSLFQWGVVERETGAVIGTGTLSSLSAEHRRAEVGFALARSAWGRGHAREIVAALLAFAFGALGLHRVEADVDPRNAPSIRTLEGAGFVREGHQRERYFLAGEVQDALLYGLLRREWPVRGGA